jgi:hypothetical protein
VQLDGVRGGVRRRVPVVSKRAITNARRDEAAEGEDEQDRDQLGPEANYRTPPGGSV